VKHTSDAPRQLPIEIAPADLVPATTSSQPLAPTGLVLVSHSGEFLSANAAAIDALDSRFPVLRDKGWAGLFDIPTPLAEGLFSQTIAGHPVTIKASRAGMGPRDAWVLTISRDRVNAAGAPPITSEAELNAAIRAFVEQLPMFMWLERPDGTVVYANRYTENWLAQLGMASNVGRTHEEALPPHLAEHSRIMGERTLASSEPHAVESNLRIGDEMRWFEAIRAKVPSPDGRVLIGAISRDTTDAHVARDALAASERVFRRFSELGRIGVWMGPPDLKSLTHINDEFRAQFRIPEGLIGREAKEVVIGRIPPDEAPLVAARFKRLLGTEGPAADYIQQDHRIIWPDGTVRHIAGVAWRIVDSHNTLIGLGGVTRDVTDEIVAKQAAAQADARFRMAVDSIRDQFWIATPDLTRLVFVNHAFREMFGADTDAIISDTSRGMALINPADLPEKMRIMSEFIANESQDSASVTFSLTNRDGRRYINRERFWRVRDESGRTMAVAGLIADVTAETIALDKLAESEDRFRSLVESMPDSVTTFDRDGTILFTTDSSLKVGQPIWDWLGCKGQGCTASNGRSCPVCGANTRQAVATRVFDRAQIMDSEREVLRPDGSRAIMSHRIGPVERDGVVCYATAISRDVTDLRAANDRMRAAERELVRAARTRTMGELSTSLAHELNQPLSTLVASCKTLELVGESGDPNVRRAAMDAIAKAAQRATGVVARMRALASGMSVPSVTMPLDHAVNNVVEMLTNETRSLRFAVTITANAQTGWSIPDAIGFQQVLLNLVRNSIEAMENTKPDDRIVTINATSDGKLVMVFVRDFGPGIPDDIRARLFEPFASTKPKGLGLGLSISRGIVEQQGCKLWAAQTPGQTGTSMAFTWPVAPQPADAAASNAHNCAAAAHGPGTKRAANTVTPSSRPAAMKGSSSRTDYTPTQRGHS
jgi:PAS domain S-box-containing protein